MIRNEKEYRHSKERIDELEGQLSSLPSERSGVQSQINDAVRDALRMQIEDIEREIEEYKDLKEGRLLSFSTNDLDGLGEIITKARIAQGLTQSELGKKLGMTQQQVQRYERDSWHKISIWRLAEAADALGLDLTIRARISASSTASVG